jgi:hypothetical protein
MGQGFEAAALRAETVFSSAHRGKNSSNMGIFYASDHHRGLA